jgi:hypothetical protein
LFPFVLRARKLIAGRERIERSKSKLHFILISTDLSPASRDRLLQDFSDYPIVQLYTSAELEKFFAVRGAKVLGFAKSPLAKSIYAELKPHRINMPPPAGEASEAPPEAAQEPHGGPDPAI